MKYLPGFQLFICFHVCVMLWMDHIKGNNLQSVWVRTPDDGPHDHWTPNVYNYYTNLNNFQLNRYQEECFNFSVQSNGTHCFYKFVLLSAASDLQTNYYYEIYFSNIYIHVRRGGLYENFAGGVHGEYIFPSSFTPTNCEEFRKFDILWDNHGQVTIVRYYTSTTVIFTDPLTPFEIKGLGIKTGFGDEGLWKIKQSGIFTGFFCVMHQSYGAMAILMSTTQPRVPCTAMCAQTNECLGINHNAQTKQCELIQAGQVVVKQPAQGWKFITKCLDGRELCWACI